MSKQVNEQIRRGSPADAQHITQAFNDEYVKYYGKYVNPQELEEFLDQMDQDMDRGERPEEIVRTVEIDDEFVGVGAIKLKDNLAELGSTIIEPDYRGRTTNGGQGLYDRLFVDRLRGLEDEEINSATEMVDDPEDPVDLVYTQLLADKNAATQHTADKHDFAVTGVYDKKFPVAYEGKGRVTVVDMLWADSHIENDQQQLYIPESGQDAVKAALSNINSKRSREEAIEREIKAGYQDATERRYDVKAKAVDDPMNFAEIKVVESADGEHTWYDVMQEISEAQEVVDDGESDYWLGVSLDANNPYAVSAGEELEEFGFEYAGFNPGKLEAGDENRDALEMQYRPSDEEYVKQFVNEAADFIREAGIEHSEADESTGHWNSEAMEI